MKRPLYCFFSNYLYQLIFTICFASCYQFFAFYLVFYVDIPCLLFIVLRDSLLLRHFIIGKLTVNRCFSKLEPMLRPNTYTHVIPIQGIIIALRLGIA